MPFEKGKSGNAKTVFTSANQPANRGRKTSDLQRCVADMLSQEHPHGGDVLGAILSRIANDALMGNLRAAEMLLAYAYGRPKQQIEHSLDGEKVPPVVIVFTDTTGGTCPDVG